MQRRRFLFFCSALLASCGTVAPTANRASGPTVVFEAGLGDGARSFAPVARRLSPNIATYTYARPGYAGAGPSGNTDGDGRRTGVEIADHLMARLRAESVPGPYVLVGHSIGGLYAQTFARRYAEDTAALVLVDSRPVGFTDACFDAELGWCQPPAAIRVTMPAHQRAELDGLAETERFLASFSSGLPSPSVVLAATEPDLVTSRQFQALWLVHQEQQARRLGSRFVRVDGASHYIHRQNPDLVAARILEVLRGLA